MTTAERVQLYLKLALPLLLLFVIVFGGTNWLGSLREEHYHFYFQWELGIPFIAEMILVYLSIQLLFLLPALHCDKTGMIILAKRMALAIILAGFCHLTMPAEPVFPHHDTVDSYQWLFTLLYTLDPKHNLFPSLHITLSTLVVIAILKHVSRALGSIYLIWLAALYLSVLLIHQHHIPDIIAGLLLTLLCVRLVPVPNQIKGYQMFAAGR
jgi:membrane-associated phospholipid phosphatase